MDIFDAGPTVEAKVDNIATIRNAKTLSVEIGECQGETTALIANDKLVDFRATVAQVNLPCDADTITLSAELAKALHLNVGDSVSVAAL